MREKLIELMDEYLYPSSVEGMADHLIANGVTIQKWIPVTERLPEQGQEVIVYDGGVLKSKVFCYLFWNPNYDSWARVTHWMPLPEPPSGERRTDDERTG